MDPQQNCKGCRISYNGKVQLSSTLSHVIWSTKNWIRVGGRWGASSFHEEASQGKLKEQGMDTAFPSLYKIFPGNPVAPAKRLTLDFRGAERRLRVIAIGNEEMELRIANFGFATTRLETTESWARATDWDSDSFLLSSLFSLEFIFKIYYKCSVMLRTFYKPEALKLRSFKTLDSWNSKILKGWSWSTVWNVGRTEWNEME